VEPGKRGVPYILSVFGQISLAVFIFGFTNFKTAKGRNQNMTGYGSKIVLQRRTCYRYML
jgi:hypothetical protein